MRSEPFCDFSLERNEMIMTTEFTANVGISMSAASTTFINEKLDGTNTHGRSPFSGSHQFAATGAYASPAASLRNLNRTS